MTCDSGVCSNCLDLGPDQLGLFKKIIIHSFSRTNRLLSLSVLCFGYLKGINLRV